MSATRNLGIPMRGCSWVAIKQRIAPPSLISIAVSVLLFGVFSAPAIWQRGYSGFGFDSETGVVANVAAGSPANRAGIAVGDVLNQIDGIDLKDARPFYRNTVVGSLVRYEFLHEGRAYNINLVFDVPSVQVVANRATHWVLGVAFWLLGLSGFLQQKTKRVGQDFLMVCTWGAFALWLIPYAANQEAWAFQLMLIAHLLAGVSFLRFHLNFPMNQTTPLWRAFLNFSYIVAGGLSLIFLIISPAQLSNLSRLLGARGDLSGSIARIYFVVMIVAGLALLIRAYRHGSGSTRRRVRLVVFGTIVGFAPLLVSFVLEVLINSPLPYRLSAIPLVAVPIIYTISISRSDLMIVDHFLYRLLVVLVVGLSLLILYLALMNFVGIFAPQVAYLPLTGAVACLIIVAISVPLQGVVRLLLGRVFYGQRYDDLEVLSSSVRRLADDLNEETLAEVLTHEIPMIMGVTRAGLWRLHSETHLQWIGGRLVPEPGETLLALDQIPMELQRGEIVRQPIEAGPILPVSGDVRWWVPLMLSGELQGLWAIGPQVNDESFGPIDQKLMKASADQGAFAIKVFQLVARLTHQLQQTEFYKDELQAAYSLQFRAREEERSHLSRELHDGLIQQLYALGYRLKSAQAGVDSQLSHQLELCQEQINDMVSSARRICYGLRPADLERLGLTGALRRLVRELSEHSEVEVELNITPPNTRFEEDLEMVLYRIAQEALANIAKHANACHAEVRLAVSSESAVLFVQDDGVGFKEEDVAGKRLGIIGMRERAHAFGGEMTIETAPGNGTAIWTKIPRGQT